MDTDEDRAFYAHFRRSFRARVKERIDVLEVYCKTCRRPIDDVGDQPCAAKVNNDHLIGGRLDKTRAPRRKPLPLAPGTVVVAGPTINRRGLDAVLRGEA